ncbi:MAG: hypothetical protein Q9210_006619, partial [Variospora velana]
LSPSRFVMDAVIGAGRTSKIVCPVGSGYERVPSSSALLVMDAVVVVSFVLVPPTVVLTVDTVLVVVVVVVRWPGICGDSGTGKTDTAGTGNGSIVVVGLISCGYAPGKTMVPIGYGVKVYGTSLLLLLLLLLLAARSSSAARLEIKIVSSVGEKGEAHHGTACVAGGGALRVVVAVAVQVRFRGGEEGEGEEEKEKEKEG